MMAKARVAPLKVMSIPRLELTADVVSANVALQLIEELDYHVDADIYYSDSTVVLGYIRNKARQFHVYVGNRVQQIRNKTTPESWLNVKGKENSADIVGNKTLSNDCLIVYNSKYRTLYSGNAGSDVRSCYVLAVTFYY